MSKNNLLQNEPLGEKLIKKGFWLYLLTYLAAPAGYLIRVIVSNSISVEEVGVLYSIISLVSLIGIYNDLGLTESLQYFLPKFWIKKQYNFVKTSIFLSLSIQITTAIIIAIFLWIGAPWLAEHYFQYEAASSVLRYICFYFLGINLFQVFGSIFISFQDTFNNKFTELVRVRATVFFTVGFFLLGSGSLINYAIAWIGGMFLALITASYLFKKHYQYLITKGKIVYDTGMIHEYRKYALWVFIGANAGMLLGQIDQQMIIILLGATSAGYYANYLSLFQISNIVVLPLLGLLFPLVTELITKKELHKLSLLQNFMYTYMSILAISLSGLFIALGPEIATILFGKKFALSGELLRFGGGFLVLTVLLSISLAILTGLGRVKERVMIIASVGVGNIIMNFILIKFWGLYGVIISTILGLLIMLWGCITLINKYQKITVQRKFISINVLAISLLSGIIYLYKQDIFILDDANRVTNLLRIICLGCLYYLILGAMNRRKILLLKNEIIHLRNNK